MSNELTKEEKIIIRLCKKRGILPGKTIICVLDPYVYGVVEDEEDWKFLGEDLAVGTASDGSDLFAYYEGEEEWAIIVNEDDFALPENRLDAIRIAAHLHGIRSGDRIACACDESVGIVDRSSEWALQEDEDLVVGETINGEVLYGRYEGNWAELILDHTKNESVSNHSFSDLEKVTEILKDMQNFLDPKGLQSIAWKRRAEQHGIKL